MSTPEIEKIAAQLYGTYCDALGGLAYDLQPFPSWTGLRSDPAKRRQTSAWLAVAALATPAAALQAEMRAGVEAVIRGDATHFRGRFVPPALIEEYLEGDSWEKGAFTASLQAYDWRFEFVRLRDGTRFTASGSGYLGTFEFAETAD